MNKAVQKVFGETAHIVVNKDSKGYFGLFFEENPTPSGFARMRLRFSHNKRFSGPNVAYSVMETDVEEVAFRYLAKQGVRP